MVVRDTRHSSKRTSRECGRGTQFIANEISSTALPGGGGGFLVFKQGWDWTGADDSPRTDVIVTLFGVTYGNSGCPARVSISNESQE